MAKYHNGANGPALCHASVKECPIGGKHFTTKHEAQEVFEKDLIQKQKDKEGLSKSIVNNKLKNEHALIKPDTLPDNIEDVEKKYFKYLSQVESERIKEDYRIKPLDQKRLTKRMEKNSSILKNHTLDLIKKEVDKNGSCPITNKDFNSYDEDLSIPMAKLGKIKSATVEQKNKSAQIVFDNGKQKVVYYTEGDCCSTSTIDFSKDDINKLKNHKITGVTQDKSNNYEDEGDIVVVETPFKIHLDDGSTVEFKDINYSNGFYSSMTSWQIKDR